jgi:hypothetical protein
MAFLTLNGRDVFAATLTVPRARAWRFDAVVDAESVEGLTGQVELTLDEGRSSWKGTAVWSGENFGKVELRAVGGAGGLATVLPGQSYRQIAAGAVLADILGAAGETLDTASTPAALDTLLPHWSRVAGPCCLQLEQLVVALGATWRVLANGRIWVGVETWPAAPAFEAEVLSVDPGGDRGEIAGVQAYRLLPGQIWAERRVGCVEHRFTADAIRTSVVFERG